MRRTKEELEKIIKDAQEELARLNKPMTWQEACQYMYENKEKKMQVRGLKEAGIYHSYEGIGILYAKHVFEQCHDTYVIR